MRILLVNYEYPPLGGGGGNAAREIARRLARRGHEAAVLTTRFRGQPAEETEDGVRLIRLWAPRRRDYQCAVWEMAAFMAAGWLRGPARVAAFRPDAAVAFFALPSGVPALRIARKLDIPLATYLLGADVPGPGADEVAHLHALARPVLRRVWKASRVLVANSEGLRRAALAFDPSCPVDVIPHGVDTDKFSPATDEEREARPIGGLSEVVLTAACRLSKEKQIDWLLRALAALPRELPLWRLRIAGDGPLRAELERLACDLDLAERVQFLGWVEKEAMPGVYRQSDAFVLVSTREGSPNVVLEAQASGLAVLGTRVCGTEELIRDGESGLLVDLPDDAGLQEALARLIADASLRRRLGAAARRQAETLSWDAAAERFEDLCERLTK